MKLREVILDILEKSSDDRLDLILDPIMAKPLGESEIPENLPTPIIIEKLPLNNKSLSVNVDDNFPYACKIVANAEGGWCNTPGDKGGETIFGIARNYHPEWSGWVKVDEVAAKYGRGTKEFIKIVNNDNALKESAHNFFYTYFWLPCNADKLPKEIGIIVYDMEINSGNHAGQKMLQKTLNSLGYDLKVDGMIGGKTIAAAIDCYDDNKVNFIETFLKLRYNFYHEIVIDRPDQLKFWKTWVNRLRALGVEFLGSAPGFLTY